MFLIESRRARPTHDPIFALNGEANARKAAGEDIINATLGAAANDDGTLSVFPSMVSALRELDPGTIAEYAPIAGVPAFLRAVTQDMFGTVPALAERAVAVATPGGTGALHHAIVNFLEPGQALLTTNYFWAPYHTLSDETGRTLQTFRMFDDHGGFDVAALDEAVTRLLQTQGRVLVCLNDPCHNPTGYSMRSEEWRAVVECLSKHAKAGGTVGLLIDAAYIEYGPGDTRAFLQQVAPLADHALVAVAWSASKSFAMYGLRVGALLAVVPESERAATQAALTYSCRGTWSNCNHGGMVAITHLLSDPQAHAALQRERQALKEMLFARVACFNQHAAGKLRYPRYEGGFFVTVFDAEAKEQAARMRERGVFVVPSQDCLRVALCSVAERDIPRVCEALQTR